jgi:uncharacterized membrane protein YphA (DoxX/SURF4 family)
LRLARWLRALVFAPQPIVRLEAVRILAPLAILGFLSGRLVHADFWLTHVGFQVPDLGGGDFRQPLYQPALPVPAAWALAALTVVAGLATAAGLATRLASGLYALCLIDLALADRLEAFTVSKLGALIAVALFFSPAGARFGVDAWRRHRRQPDQPLPALVDGGNVRFLQATVLVLYLGSGLCKLHGDWLRVPNVLWTHLHDSYQTGVTYFLAQHLPSWSWTVLQGVVLVYEVGAPLWFSLDRTRPIALAVGLGMHATIGLCFGPVVWFALLMASLLLGCFAPEKGLARAFGVGTAPITQASPQPAARR